MNKFIWSTLRDSWDDDGSERFAYFGLTGIRTMNLMSKRTSTYMSSVYGQTANSVMATYTLDQKGRVRDVDVVSQTVYEIEPENGQPEPVRQKHYVITYVAD